MQLLPDAGSSPLSGVVNYLRFVLEDGPDLGGSTKYSDLSDEDVFLAACYYGEGQARSALQPLSNWHWSAVEAALDARDGGGGQRLNDFKVRGLQPRIAELAFRRVFAKLRGPEAAAKLHDLNAEALQRLPRPWRLSPGPSLHAADWRDGDGEEYDVKCNLFFRSKQDTRGLRGFLVELKDGVDAAHAYPGFIFTGSTDRCCAWTYVGDYHPSDEASERRVLPFLFRLPKKCRFTPPPGATTSEQLDAYLLRDRDLIIGCQLAVRQPLVRSENVAPEEALLGELADLCAGHYREMCLEQALWKAMTFIALKGCSSAGPGPVTAFLSRMDALIRSPALPVRLPRIGDDPIISKWIEQVLRPLAENWHRISCPNCRQNGSVPGLIQLRRMRMDEECAIEGELLCKECGTSQPGVTILTHCCGCKSYPLIIGQNQVCHLCKGLICHNASDSGGRPCNRCKRRCDGWQARDEADRLPPDMGARIFPS